MIIYGMMRVKNEARWIQRCVASILPLCDRVFVLDDHSTDGTPQLCRELPKVSVFDSPFTGLDEARDKNHLLNQCEGADWILSIDGDEMLDPQGLETLRHAFEQRNYPAIALPILYLWNDEQHVRTDRVYGEFRRESAFRPDGSRFESTVHGGNFHCGNVPARLRQKRLHVNAPLLHFGYMHKEDRVRKYEWYNQMDPQNHTEDQYRHMVIGDLFPADSRFMHGGPLHLEAR